MSKCVANLYRYVEICLGANRRYLDALASVDDPGPSRRELKELGQRVIRKGRPVSGFTRDAVERGRRQGGNGAKRSGTPANCRI
jgi:hypothetical protein